MRKAFIWTSMVLLLLLALPLTATAADISVGRSGLPTFIQGDLGQIDAIGQNDPMAKSKDADQFRASAKNFAMDMMFTHFEATGLEDLFEKSVRVDDLGKVHVRFGQTINGLAVEGADLIVHADAFTGGVYAINGVVLPATDKVALAPTLGPESSRQNFDKAGSRFQGPAELSYVVDEKGARAVLSWKRTVEYRDAEGFHRDIVFTDATTGDFVTRHATIHTAKNWKTYSANNGTSLPGTLKCTNTGSCGDSVAQAAHNNASATYDYYKAKFNRNSLNGNDLLLTSTVHYSSNYNNAYWDGSQMVYGDGDGSVFSPLGGALDVVAHELTHGVTEYESGLIYQNESGALNEAMSDIMSSAAEAWSDGSISANTWKLGEDIYTPGTSGDALRYMNNPTQDGGSYDYYPERYTGSSDNGGVHSNSGIANLAFYLMVQGGTHPRNKTTNTVPAIGMAKAEQIMYRAQTNYLTSSSNFQAMRNATAQAATDLYGTTETDAVQQAWCAVGVPGCPGGGGGGGGGVLTNGVPKTGQSGSSGSDTFYTIAVPAGATNLSITTSGGSGDPDLYVKFGSQPTTSSYTCRSWASGPTESCSFASPSTGTYHVLVHGYSAYSGLTVTASYTAGSSNSAPNAGFTHSESNLTASFTDTSSDSDGTIASRSWNFGDGGTSTSTNPSHTYSSAGTYTVTLTVTDDDGATDSASASVTVTAPPSGGSVLTNGVPKTGLSGASGANTYYTIVVPSGASNLVFSMSGGSGDADMYVRFGSQPTTSTYDCRPYLSGNNETCTFAAPSAGTYHVMLRGYSAYSGVSLVATFDTGGGGSCGDSSTVTSISGSSGSTKNYTFAVDGCASTATIKISGGSGDADLYVRFGAAPTTSTWDCRPYKNGNNETCTFTPPQNGTYYIMLRGYSTYSGVTLSASYE